MSSDKIVSRYMESLEGLPKMIAAALSKREEQIRQKIEEQIEKILEDFDFGSVAETTLRPLIHNSLTKALESHFESQAGQKLLEEHFRGFFDSTKKNGVLNVKIGDKDWVPSQDQLDAISKTVNEASAPAKEDSEESQFLTLDEWSGLPAVVEFTSPISKDSFMFAMRNLNTGLDLSQHILILTHSDALILADFGSDFFDPVTKYSDLQRGAIGHFMTMDVYSYADIGPGAALKSRLAKKPIPHTSV